jgi:hypothetical protein
MKLIIGTVDRYGLRKIHLQKHKKDVEKFYTSIFLCHYSSDIALKYQKRFSKYRDRLFTFLDFDNIPWNNNNAEHAIKGFAAYRNIADSQFTENGIQQYLTLFSIYQTCHYKGIDFLKFLLSKETDIDKYCEQY